MDPLDPSVSPLGVSLGPELGQYYRGGAVVAIVLYASLSITAFFVASIYRLRKNCLLASSLAALRFPSVGMIPVSLFGQGLASCGVSLIRLGASAEDIALGVAAITICLILALGAGYLTTIGLECDLVAMEPVEGRPRILKAFLRIAVWNMYWQNKSFAIEFKRRHMLLIDDLRLPWWTAVELTSTLVQGAVLGIRDNSPAMCRIQRGIVAAITAAMVFGAAYFRPCGAYLSNAFLILSKVCSFAVAMMVLLQSMTLDDTFDSAAQMIAAISTGIGSCQVLVQVLLVALNVMHLLPRFWGKIVKLATKQNGRGCSNDGPSSTDQIVNLLECSHATSIMDESPTRGGSIQRADRQHSPDDLLRTHLMINAQLRSLVDAVKPTTPCKYRLTLLVQAACSMNGNSAMHSQET